MHICVTRFNNESYSENIRYRQNHNIKCIYGSPKKIAETIMPYEYIMILEMNNDTDKIEGIGIVQNQLCYNRHRIYTEHNYNRYIYKSNKYITIESLSSLEKKIIVAVQDLLFKSKGHVKRGNGIQLIPKNMLNNTFLVKILKNICKNHYGSKSNT